MTKTKNVNRRDQIVYETTEQFRIDLERISEFVAQIGHMLDSRVDREAVPCNHCGRTGRDVANAKASIMHAAHTIDRLLRPLAD